MTLPTPPTSDITPGGPGGAWTVAATAARLGVAASTLRSWSLRYGIGPAAHHAGKHRRYTADDIAELDAMRRLVDQGMALPAAAAMVRRHRRDDPSDTPGERIPATAVYQLVAAARDLDPVAATAIVSAALARCGVQATWEELCRPALVALDNALIDNPGPGGRSTGPGSCIEAELMASRAVATALHRLPAPPPPPGARRVLLACAEGEEHTLGLEALCAALVEQSVDARMLGGSVDDATLSVAIDTLRPSVVVVWAQVPAAADPALVDARAAGPALAVAAGPGWAGRSLDPLVTRANSLRDAIAAATGTKGLHAEPDPAGTVRIGRTPHLS